MSPKPTPDVPDNRPSPEEEREQAIRKLVRDLEQKLRRELNLDPASLDEMEDQTQRIGDEFKQQIDRELAKRKGKGQQALAKTMPTALCACGRKARCRGLRTRQMVLLSGVHAFRRAYYHCTHCHRGFAPMDAWMGASQGQSSRRVVTLTARLSCFLTDRLVAPELLSHRPLGRAGADGAVWDCFVRAYGSALFASGGRGIATRVGSPARADAPKPPSAIHGAPEAPA